MVPPSTISFLLQTFLASALLFIFLVSLFMLALCFSQQWCQSQIFSN
jgi:hypothetical protein